MTKRDYDLMGESGRQAVETGLAAAEWYHTDISRKQMKELMQRSDGPAIRDARGKSLPHRWRKACPGRIGQQGAKPDVGNCRWNVVRDRIALQSSPSASPKT